MAKQLVNPVERHVDKVVLGLAGLILLGSIARFLVTSPNQLEIGGEAVTPSSVDRKVVQAADAARDRMINAPVEVERPERRFADFESRLTPFEDNGLAQTLPAAVAFGPAVPLIDVRKAVGEAKLVSVAAMTPDPPVVLYGRTLFEVPQRGGQSRREPRNWVTLTASFDVKRQMEVQREEYGAARKEIFFGPMQIQRRAQRLDGSWADDDWADVIPTPALDLPPMPKVEFEMEGDRTVVPGLQLAAIETFFSKISEPLLQLELIRPMIYAWVPGRGDPWTVPIVTSERDVIAQDAYYQEKPSNRYLEEEDVVTEEIPSAQRLDQLERDLAAAWQHKSEEAATIVYNEALTIEEDTDTGQSLRKRAERLRAKANQRIGDIKRWTNLRGPAAGGAPGPQAKQVAALPVQQLWAHDAGADSIQSDRVYQYRVRPTLYNRLLGEPVRFRKKDDAAVVFAPGQWSQAVEVRILPDVSFFVTGEDERNERVNVEVYQWFEGVWVKSSRFKFALGDKLSGESRNDVPAWDVDESVPENVLVQYEADATIVDLDFKRPLRERKRGSGRGGVKFGSAKESCSVVLLDAAGRLHERFVPTDKYDPDKKTYGSLVYKPETED